MKLVYLGSMNGGVSLFRKYGWWWWYWRRVEAGKDPTECAFKKSMIAISYFKVPISPVFFPH